MFIVITSYVVTILLSKCNMVRMLKLRNVWLLNIALEPNLQKIPPPFTSVVRAVEYHLDYRITTTEKKKNVSVYVHEMLKQQ